MAEVDWYAAGIEPLRMARGWALITGSEGEDPTARAFFLDEDTADACAAIYVSDEVGPLFFDPSVVLAVVHDGEIYASNDYTIDTHEKLEAAITSALAAAKEGGR